MDAPAAEMPRPTFTKPEPTAETADLFAGEPYELIKGELRAFEAELGRWSIYNPLPAWGRAAKFRTEMRRLTARVEVVNAQYEYMINTQPFGVAGHALVAGSRIPLLSHRIQSLRSRLSAVASLIDQKAAFSLAVFSLYVSLLSLLLSLISLAPLMLGLAN